MKESTFYSLTTRKSEAESLRRPLIASLGIHLVLLIALVFSPGNWLVGQDADAAGSTMAIRLGGPDGPGEGGLTPMGGRPIQEVVPLPEARRPQWIQPPSPTPPKMVMPVATEEARRRPEPETESETVPDEARGRTPTRGPEVRDGSAMSETGLEGIGIGLSTGGLGGNDSEVILTDFCCPDYVATMLQLIRRRWDSNQSLPGVAVIRFTIDRSGTIDRVGVDRESGYLALDMSAQRAVLLTRQLPPLPSAFTENSLTVRLTFEYQS